MRSSRNDTMHHSRTDEGTTTILRVRGELDALSAPHLRTVLEGLVEDQRYDITVDLVALRLIDACGIGTLVWFYKQVRAHGGVVRFVGVTAQPLVIFNLLRLDMAFGLAEPDSDRVCGAGTQELKPVDPRASESGV